ncbi:MAG: UDP-N-acetylmuramoyl-L-alanyl-D-glutamate--2,6-diaminopimelate ligase [Phycisphaerales bacterium]
MERAILGLGREGMQLASLIEGLGVTLARGEASSVRVCDVTEDSRTAVPGSLFVARRGRSFDGRKFVGPAIECGASAVLTDDPEIELPRHPKVALLVTDDVAGVSARIAERFYGEPSKKLILVGVTGTNGKTTVAHLTQQMLNAADVRCGLIGTVDVDDGREVAPASMTTPPAIELSRTLATMVEQGLTAAAMEVSSHALDQGRAAALAFDVAVFTNLTGDHLDYHQTMEAYAASKAKLFAMLPPDGVSVLNADDPAHASMRGANPTLCTMEGAPGAAWSASVVKATPAGLTLHVRGPGVDVEAVTPLLGAHNAMNALEAIAAGAAALRKAGKGDDTIADAARAMLERARPPRGRLERVTTEADDITVFVDFAHTDDALEKVLSALREVLPAGAGLWVVVGCGGNKDQTKRPRMGRVAAALADQAVFTSDNPRTEPPGQIITQMMGGVPEPARRRIVVQADRSRAIHHAIEHAKAGAVIVLAGKGHETEQELPSAEGGVVRIAFDDREVARRALAMRRARSRATAGGAA